MNLMDMFNGLNRLDDLQPFSPGAYLLAVKLIHLLNGLFWPEQVSIDLGRMGVMAKCSSRSATLCARDELLARGVLILVSRGKKGSPSVYRMADLPALCLKDGQNQDRKPTESRPQTDRKQTENGPKDEPNHGHISRQDKTNTRPDERHTQTNTTENRNARARTWFDPDHPERPCDDAWKTNPRARGAIAQRLIDHFPDMKQDFLQTKERNLHHLLCNAMKAGIEPEWLQDMGEECDTATLWAKCIVQYAYNSGQYRARIGRDYLEIFYRDKRPGEMDELLAMDRFRGADA